MPLSSKRLSELIRNGNSGDRLGIFLTPYSELQELERSGEAAVSLRLGRWFLSMKQTIETQLEAAPKSTSAKFIESKVVKKHFVPFGESFVVHPGRFVLASTLEWLRLPTQLAGYVTGKSTWGRRGIVIETAASTLR